MSDRDGEDVTGTPKEYVRPTRIVSGGQTGVDRGALDAAIEFGIVHGGWCPKGRRAEDGVIPVRYLLTETEHKGYRSRTRQNVVDSDGTLALFRSQLSGGTELTLCYAERFGKPHLALSLDENPDPERVRAWLREHRISVLNVAGPRESEFPGAQALAARFLKVVLR